MLTLAGGVVSCVVDALRMVAGKLAGLHSSITPRQLERDYAGLLAALLLAKIQALFSRNTEFGYLFRPLPCMKHEAQNRVAALVIERPDLRPVEDLLVALFDLSSPLCEAWQEIHAVATAIPGIPAAAIQALDQQSQLYDNAWSTLLRVADGIVAAGGMVHPQTARAYSRLRANPAPDLRQAEKLITSIFNQIEHRRRVLMAKGAPVPTGLENAFLQMEQAVSDVSDASVGWFEAFSILYRQHGARRLMQQHGHHELVAVLDALLDADSHVDDWILEIFRSIVRAVAVRWMIGYAASLRPNALVYEGVLWSLLKSDYGLVALRDPASGKTVIRALSTVSYSCTGPGDGWTIAGNACTDTGINLVLATIQNQNGVRQIMRHDIEAGTNRGVVWLMMLFGKPGKLHDYLDQLGRPAEFFQNVTHATLIQACVKLNDAPPWSELSQKWAECDLTHPAVPEALRERGVQAALEGNLAHAGAQIRDDLRALANVFTAPPPALDPSRPPPPGI